MKVTCSAICGAASFNNLGPMPSVPVALLISKFEKIFQNIFLFNIRDNKFGVSRKFLSTKFSKLFMTSIFNRLFYL